jgi:hypothetical protein
MAATVGDIRLKLDLYYNGLKAEHKNFELGVINKPFKVMSRLYDPYIKAKDKDGVSKSFDNPMLWFGLNYKKEDETSLTTLDFSYKIDDKTKFKIKHFDVNIYNNKHVVNREPQLATVNNELINNFNIDKFLTIKSELYGFVYMQVKASKQSFNLNTKLYHSLS